MQLWFILLLYTLRVEFYIKRLPLTIQCLLSGYECLSRSLPNTDYFLVSLTVQVAEWNQALSLCFSSRYSYTSKILCERLRYKADKSEITLVESTRKISKKHKCSLVFPLLLLAPSSSLCHSPSSTPPQASPRKVLCIEFETTWLGDLKFPSPLNLIIPWIYSK